jgi:hypothetical protein
VGGRLTHEKEVDSKYSKENYHGTLFWRLGGVKIDPSFGLDMSSEFGPNNQKIPN